MRLLFTGGGGAGNEAIWRLLGNRYEVHFGDADVHAIHPAIPRDRRHGLPWASDERFIDKMSALCRRLRIDILIPGVDEELLELAKRADRLAPTHVLVPDPDYVELMLDKWRMVGRLDAKGIDVPNTWLLSDAAAAPMFPCIVKPRRGRGSHGVRVLNMPRDARHLRIDMADRADTMLLQERVAGIEYTVQMAADESGRLVAVVPVKVHVKRGITLHAETHAEDRVMDACRKIHTAVPTWGCYNIQLILTSAGRAVPFEINPRVSTTFCLVLAAGVDPIKIYTGTGGHDNQSSFTSGLQLRRYWINHFSSFESE